MVLYGQVTCKDKDIVETEKRNAGETLQSPKFYIIFWSREWYSLRGPLRGGSGHTYNCTPGTEEDPVPLRVSSESRQGPSVRIGVPVFSSRIGVSSVPLRVHRM